MKRWFIIALFLGTAIAALLLIGRFAAGPLANFAEWVESLGPWAPVVFIAGYVIATVAFVPASLLTLAGGAIFGLFHGALYVFIGATLGSTAAFLVSRYAARPFVERKLADNSHYQRTQSAIKEQGGRIVLLLRLSPLLPFNALNYALGISKVGIVPFVLGSVGMIPGTILYVYYGKLAGDLASLGSGGVEKGAAYYGVALLGLAATIALAVIGARVGKRALGEKHAA